MLSIFRAIKLRRANLFNNAIFISISPTSLHQSSLTNVDSPIHHSLFYCPYSTASPSPIQDSRFNPSSTSLQLVESFKDWFHPQRKHSIDRIFAILGSKDEVDEAALSQLGLRLNEQLVLEVLRYGFRNKEILSSLKFFNWAGGQRGYCHSRTAFMSLFKGISKAKLTPLLLDYLDNCRLLHNKGFPGGFHATLVMGYSVAGMPQLALQLFGEMRFRGQDLDSFTYHALLGSLVDGGCFDAAKVIAKEISVRGFENHVTHSMLVKSFCRQNMFDKAKSYLQQVVQLGNAKVLSSAVGVLVNSLCKEGSFNEAEQVIEEFRDLGVIAVDRAYNVLLRNLVQSNKLDEALGFLKSKILSRGFVPEILHYHKLLCRLMKENRLLEACDLLVNMMEEGVPPNKATMDIAFRFFCKGGMVDVAMELYKCRSEISLSPTVLSYNYLINYLCQEWYLDEAYNVFKDCVTQGHFPAFSILINTLCREGKLDKAEELFLIALKGGMIPSIPASENLISALCRAGKYEACFLIYEELTTQNKVGKRTIYSNLTQRGNKINNRDVASRLLTEMQEKAHNATWKHYRAIIRTLCETPDGEIQCLNLLARRLSKDMLNREVYSNFIYGAAQAGKPQLAREVLELMKQRGIQPSLSSYILVLQSYLKSNRISDALKFFIELQLSVKVHRKLYNIMIVGLSKANREDIALNYLTEMRGRKLVPTNECYEVLVQKLCYKKQYDVAVDLVKKLDRDGHRVTTFLGNTLLLYCLKSGELYDTWIRATEHETSNYLVHFGQVMGVISGHVRVIQEMGELEEMIRQCFPLDLYTYNCC